jgi:hypothetical protein
MKALRVELMLATLAPFAALTWAPHQRVRMRLAPDVLLAASAPAGSDASPAADKPEPEVKA